MFPGYRLALLAAVTAGSLANAQDWNSWGNGATRNGYVATNGPTDANADWSINQSTIITWAVAVAEGRVFTVRSTGFPGSSGPGDRLHAWSADDGSPLWDAEIPYASGDWIGYVGGAGNGKVYTARGNGSGGTSDDGPITAFDAATGNIVWTSADTIKGGMYDGFAFATNGDLIVTDNNVMRRIDHTDGSTVWSATRSASVSGQTAAAVTEDAAFLANTAPGGQIITKYDLATGAVLYQSEVMPGFTVQNTPFVSRDGSRVYLSRTQNNDTTDFLYAFDDTGTALEQAWAVETAWTTQQHSGIDRSGRVVTFNRDRELVKLDPATGAEVFNAGVPAGFSLTGNFSPKVAVDATGRVYVSNGWASSPADDGFLNAYSNDLSTLLFSVQLGRPNAGGPALTGDGLLVIADLAGLRALRGSPLCDADFNQSGGQPNTIDLIAFINAFRAGC